MKSRTTRRFRELLSDLPKGAQLQAKIAYRLFRANPSHPGLRFKMVYPKPPTYSVRIGIGHRAVGILDGDTVIWFWIGSHANYDKLLDEM